MPLYPWYGGTEFGPHTKIFDIDEASDAPTAKTRADWEWMAFTERVQPRWDPQGDGTYELQYVVSANMRGMGERGLMARSRVRRIARMSRTWRMDMRRGTCGSRIRRRRAFGAC